MLSDVIPAPDSSTPVPVIDAADDEEGDDATPSESKEASKVCATVQLCNRVTVHVNREEVCPVITCTIGYLSFGTVKKSCMFL